MQPVFQAVRSLRWPGIARELPVVTLAGFLFHPGSDDLHFVEERGVQAAGDVFRGGSGEVGEADGPVQAGIGVGQFAQPPSSWYTRWSGTATYVHDGRGALAELIEANGRRTTWSYDAAGQLYQQLGRDGSLATFTYDGAGRQTGVRHQSAVGVLLDLALLTYDAAGNPTLKVTQDGPHTMTYDAANQLLAEQHPLGVVQTWTYDPAGNRLSQDRTQVGIRSLTYWTYDAAEQLQDETTGAAVTQFAFDGAGNQTAVLAPEGRTTFVWDSENRLRESSLPNGTRNRMDYRVDGLRHRLWDSEGDKLMVWDVPGPTGYGDLLEERLQDLPTLDYSNSDNSQYTPLTF